MQSGGDPDGNESVGAEHSFKHSEGDLVSDARSLPCINTRLNEAIELKLMLSYLN